MRAEREERDEQRKTVMRREGDERQRKRERERELKRDERKETVVFVSGLSCF